MKYRIKLINISFHWFALLFSLTLLGCWEKKMDVDAPDSRKVISLKSEKTILNSELVDSIKLVALETNKDVLVGEIEKISIIDNNIFVLDSESANAFFSFNKNGKYLWKYNKKGKGPDEFIGDLQDFSINTNVYILTDIGEVICLSKQGVFLWKKILDFYPRHIAKIDSGFVFGMEYHSIVKAEEEGWYYDLIVTDEQFNITQKLLPYKAGTLDTRFRAGYSLKSFKDKAIVVTSLTDSVIICNTQNYSVVKFDIPNSYKLQDIKSKEDTDEIWNKINYIKKIIGMNDSIVTFNFLIDQEEIICTYNYEENKLSKILRIEQDDKTLPLPRRGDGSSGVYYDDVSAMTIINGYEEIKDMGFSNDILYEAKKILKEITPNSNPIIEIYYSQFLK